MLQVQQQNPEPFIGVSQIDEAGTLIVKQKGKIVGVVIRDTMGEHNGETYRFYLGTRYQLTWEKTLSEMLKTLEKQGYTLHYELP